MPGTGLGTAGPFLARGNQSAIRGDIRIDHHEAQQSLPGEAHRIPDLT
jgi:hypothetical protein